MKAYIKDIIEFIKFPIDEQQSELRKSFKFHLFLIILDLLLIAFFIVALSLFYNNNLISDHEHELENFFKRNSIFHSFILIVVIAPLIEELVFRWQITYESNLLIKFLKFKNRSYLNYNKQLKMKWNKYFPIIFYLSSILFSLVHIFNYSSSIDYHEFFINLVPVFFIGLLFGFIRVRLSIKYSIIYHSFHNLILFSLILLDL